MFMIQLCLLQFTMGRPLLTTLNHPMPILDQRTLEHFCNQQERLFSPYKQINMLRRKPTAITITTEDIAAFEEAYARKTAYQHYLKTGEDPNGFFRSANPGDPDFNAQQEKMAERQAEKGSVDPNDELKPLPGYKARIVRSREERIMGTAAGGAGGGGGSGR